MAVCTSLSSTDSGLEEHFDLPWRPNLQTKANHLFSFQQLYFNQYLYTNVLSSNVSCGQLQLFPFHRSCFPKKYSVNSFSSNNRKWASNTSYSSPPSPRWSPATAQHSKPHTTSGRRPMLQRRPQHSLDNHSYVVRRNPLNSILLRENVGNLPQLVVRLQEIEVKCCCSDVDHEAHDCL